jgi:hypothetical protein
LSRSLSILSWAPQILGDPFCLRRPGSSLWIRRLGGSSSSFFLSYVVVFFIIPIALTFLLGVSTTTALAVSRVDNLFTGGSHRFVLVGPLGTMEGVVF